VQTAEPFKMIREILTRWLLLEEFLVTSNRLFFHIGVQPFQTQDLLFK